uniref:Uncharacterized protein n=1 Tax=Pararge aegeria TaxID=116150 RepID=S4PFV2_9NEOP
MLKFTFSVTRRLAKVVVVYAHYFSVRRLGFSYFTSDDHRLPYTHIYAWRYTALLQPKLNALCEIEGL